MAVRPVSVASMIIKLGLRNLVFPSPEFKLNLIEDHKEDIEKLANSPHGLIGTDQFYSNC